MWACTICGSADVIAIRPGQAAAYSNDKSLEIPEFLIRRSVADTFLCLACVPKRKTS